MAFSDINYFTISNCFRHNKIVFVTECTFLKESRRLMPAIPAFGTLRQEEHRESEPSLGCILALGKCRLLYGPCLKITKEVF